MKTKLIEVKENLFVDAVVISEFYNEIIFYAQKRLAKKQSNGEIIVLIDYIEINAAEVALAMVDDYRERELTPLATNLITYELINELTTNNHDKTTKKPSIISQG